MNGKENIISKILSDADTACAEAIKSAENQAQSISEKALSDIDADKQALNARIDVLSEERVRNRLATAELDARKYKLNAKQKLISACYDNAYGKLKAMSNKEKEAFLTRLLKTYAEKGETVSVCKADKDVVTQKFLDGLNMNLVLGKTYIDADGGVVLAGKGYEKDLTIKSVLAYIREKTEGQVANALFGE